LAIVPADRHPKGHLYAFDARSGVLQWKLGTTPLLGIASDGTLYVGSLSGVVQAFRP
jgi:outer membrane protein assembly factor BamB